MHEIIQRITALLAEQQMIPPDVWLTRLTLSHHLPQGTQGQITSGQIANPKVTFKARSQGVFYTFEGQCISRGLEGHRDIAFHLNFWQPRNPEPAKRHFGGSGGRHRFSESALLRFLAESGDLNPLHQGEMPVVPGLLIASWCLEHLPFQEPQWIIKFKQPLLAVQGFDLVETDYGFCLTDSKTLFTEVHIYPIGDQDEPIDYPTEEQPDQEQRD